MQEMERGKFDLWVRKILWRRAWQPAPVFLPGESPWTEEPGGLQLTGSQTIGHNQATKAHNHRGQEFPSYHVPQMKYWQTSPMTAMEVTIVVFSSFFRNIFLKISIIGILCYYWLNIVALDSEEVRFLCRFALSLALTIREGGSFSTVSAYDIRVDTMLFFPSICPSTYPSVHLSIYPSIHLSTLPSILGLPTEVTNFKN